VGQFEILRARSLAPLVKARGFGMTPFKTRAKLTHYRSGGISSRSADFPESGRMAPNRLRKNSFPQPTANLSGYNKAALIAGKSRRA
jgi:hypothetical protein